MGVLAQHEVFECWWEFGKAGELAIGKVESFECFPGCCVDEVYDNVPVGEDNGGSVGGIVSKTVLVKLARELKILPTCIFR